MDGYHWRDMRLGATVDAGGVASRLAGGSIQLGDWSIAARSSDSPPWLPLTIACDGSVCLVVHLEPVASVANGDDIDSSFPATHQRSRSRCHRSNPAACPSPCRQVETHLPTPPRLRICSSSMASRDDGRSNRRFLSVNITPSARRWMRTHVDRTVYVLPGIASTAAFTIHDANPFYGSILQVGLAYAIGIAFAIITCAPTSGGHFNPAVTICFAVWQDFPWKKVPYYIFAQIFGSSPSLTPRSMLLDRL
nr:putative aquaporin nip-type [Quercus suber]